MTTQVLLIIGFGVLALFGGGFFAYSYLFAGSGSMKNMMGGGRDTGNSMDGMTPQEKEFQRAKELLAKKRKKKKVKLTLEERYFQAGMFTNADRKKHERLKIIGPIAGAAILGYGGYMVDYSYAIIGVVFGVLCGLQLPNSVLDRKIFRRGEDIMFYLPLVIEEIAIGVSSSLDIGPCLQKVVSMADERDSHNVVSELLRIVITLARSGVSLEDALLEVGKRTGHLELKQTFTALAQVTRHGGEITRQLQELADAVSAQRETKIEAKIKKLELEATGPVALVFLGFMLILLTCIGMQMIKAFA